MNHKNRKKLNSEIGMFIKMARINKGMTGRDLGDRIGVSQQQISRYERGDNNITLHILNLILNCIGVSWDDLVNEVLND